MNPSSTRYSLQRVGLACFGVLGTLSLLALAGCPANLENPDQVIVAGGSTSAPDTVDLTCVTTVFNKSCATNACHDASATAAAGLNLASPGFAARMVDVQATHQLAGGACTPSKLIDSANPTMSWLLAKINGTQAMCGFQMPFGGTPLTDDEKTCITTFVMAEAAEHSGVSAGTAGAGTAGASAASGGTGGASAGSGGM